MSSSAALNSSHFNGGCLWKYQDELKVGKLRTRVISMASPSESLQFADGKANKLDKLRIGVLGASGYTGSEIIRLLANHPHFQINLMTADRKAGQSIESVFPHLVTQDLPNLVAVKDADFSAVDAVFCCLPHGTTQEIIKSLPTNLKIVDLSADFRLQDISEYEEWYGQPHKATALQKEAVYGLTEISRREIQSARLVANPGCYPTSVQLPLIPLIKSNFIEVRNIIIDSKSGVSGAGRGAKEANLYTEIAEGIHSYGITKHRHVPEIEQGLSEAANSKVTVSFTPHLMPMSRGMQSTIYVEMAPGVTTQDLKDHLGNYYEAARMEAHLEANDLWDAVTEDYEVTPLTDNPTMAQLKSHTLKKSRKSKAKTTLFVAVSQDIFTRIMNKKSAFEVWNFLKTEYEGDERIKGMQVLNLIHEFEMQQMKESETIKEYTYKLLSIANKIRLLGSEFSKSRIVQKILVTVLARLDATISSMESSKDMSKVTLAELNSALQAQEHED